MNLVNASIQIAKDSRTITEESHRVTLWSARDSAAMRTISAVTLFFLPATFTAVSYTLSETDRIVALTTKFQTFFSTTFFNFQNEGGPVVSKKWIWLYPVITILLTGVTYFAWFHSTALKMKEIVSQHESKDD